MTPNLVRLAPNVTNLGLLRISFTTFLHGEEKCSETDLEKSQICPIWGQSDPIWMANLTSVVEEFDESSDYTNLSADPPLTWSLTQDMNRTMTSVLVCRGQH